MRQTAPEPQGRAHGDFSPLEASTPRSRLRAELGREDWRLRLEHERRGGTVLTAPEPAPGVSTLVETIAARLGFKLAPWVYDVAADYLRASLKRPVPGRPEPKVAPGPKRIPRPRGRPSARWAERLSPALEKPGEWLEIELSSAHVARQTVYSLKVGRRARPPGRWEFESTGNVMRARYLGAV